MRKIIYDVAASLDGYIAGPGEDISLFPHEGDHVQAYLERLTGYDTVIMGKNTYEFGYKFGLEAGAKAYPHMRHLIFSSSIDLPSNCDVEVVRDGFESAVKALKDESEGDIYLCGGGMFAGLLLNAGLIDRLTIKQSPILLSEGIPLFAGISACKFMLEKTTQYESGVVLLEYSI